MATALKRSVDGYIRSDLKNYQFTSWEVSESFLKNQMRSILKKAPDFPIVIKSLWSTGTKSFSDFKKCTLLLNTDPDALPVAYCNAYETATRAFFEAYFESEVGQDDECENRLRETVEAFYRTVPIMNGEKEIIANELCKSFRDRHNLAKTERKSRFKIPDRNNVSKALNERFEKWETDGLSVDDRFRALILRERIMTSVLADFFVAAEKTKIY